MSRLRDREDRRRVRLIGPGLLVLPLVALTAAVAAAQHVTDSVGARALGMGGAFVAVADDATATHWNPAALAAGELAGLTIGLHRFQVGDSRGPLAHGNGRGRTTFASLGSWPVGLSAGRYERSVIQETAHGSFDVRRLTLRHGGVTVLQSVVDGLFIGSTVRVVRGEVVTVAASGTTLDAALDVAGTARGERRTHVDADLGILATSDAVRMGFTWRNLRSPSFRDADGRFVTLPRQARMGLAVLPGHGLTLALDVDLNTVDLMGDLRRMCALGGEAQLSTRLVVRTGLRWNLAVSARSVAAVGASLAVRRGLWLDAHYSSGGSTKVREVGVALRAGL
jgi:hypothetical protein